jgi:hypothetical protein
LSYYLQEGKLLPGLVLLAVNQERVENKTRDQIVHIIKVRLPQDSQLKGQSHEIINDSTGTSKRIQPISCIERPTDYQYTDMCIS